MSPKRLKYKDGHTLVRRRRADWRTRRCISKTEESKDLMDADIHSSLDWTTIPVEQGRWGKKTTTSLWFLNEVLKEETYRRVHTVRSASLRKPYFIKRRDVKVSAELSPRRKALPGAQARCLQAVESHGAAKSAF